MSSDKFIPYAQQWIDEDDVEAVQKTLRSSYIARGPKVEEFERALCGAVGAPYGVAISSGTAGLHIACLAAGIGPGDEVITSPNTFIASANCAVYCGATPIFADIDPQTYNIDPKEIEKKITDRTRAIIPVHFAGQSCDMEKIVAIARTAEKRFGHKIWIIEDACHVLDSKYRGKQVGACDYGDMAVMSFHPVKHITSGEGGVVFTRDQRVAEKLRRLRGHGITRNPSLLSHQPGPWYSEQVDLGYNYFITDMQCALGISQLKKLARFSKRRKEIVAQYNEAFRNLPHFEIPFESPDCESIFHLYIPQIDFQELGIDRARFFDELKGRGVGVQVHYIPVHLQPYYQKKFGTKYGDFPRAEAYYEKCISLPLYPKMTDAEVERVIGSVKEVLKQYSSP